MNRKLLTAGLAALAVCALPALANSENGTPASKERLICKEKGRLGSRLHRQRTCLTEAQWREATINAQRITNETVQRNMRVCGPAGGARTTC